MALGAVLVVITRSKVPLAGAKAAAAVKP